MNLAVTTVSVVVLIVGLSFGVVGALGLRGALRRNRFFGVRTEAAMRSDEAFTLANRVSGLPTVVAGVVGILGAATSLALLSIVPLAVGVVGMLAIVVAGAATGTKAADALPEPEPTLPAGCAGCACGGCSLVKR
ncbi:SdpI family protein [Kutzneria chonburiensis]|uniref:SdpI family protein n=1 Tax=Kutzneria chonburiensis TaxID=1483604 RepID=A0ABV6N193_9PSEU|nr:SdpI family protein [Kutzneria chonburiensis]